MSTVNDPKQILRILRLIFFSLMTGILLFLAVTLNVTAGLWISVFDLNDPLFLALTILSITMLPAGFLVSRKRFRKGEHAQSLPVKVEAYQSGLIIRLAVCEGISLFAIITFFITYNIFALIFMVISLGMMILNYPTMDKFLHHVKPGPDAMGKPD